MREGCQEANVQLRYELKKVRSPHSPGPLRTRRRGPHPELDPMNRGQRLPPWRSPSQPEGSGPIASASRQGPCRHETTDCRLHKGRFGARSCGKVAFQTFDTRAWAFLRTPRAFSSAACAFIWSMGLPWSAPICRFKHTPTQRKKCFRLC